MEILVGISILLVAIAGIMAYFQTNSQAARQSSAFYFSTTLAASAVEKAEGSLSNPDSLKALLAVVADSTHTRKSYSTKAGKTFTMQIKYRKVAAPSNLMSIKATVTWDGTMTNSLGSVFPYEP